MISMFAEYFMSSIFFLFPNCLLQYCNPLEIPSGNMIYFLQGDAFGICIKYRHAD